MNAKLELFFKRKSTKAIFWGLFAAGFVLVSYFYFSGYFLVSGDEGATLNCAWQLWNKKQIYVDFTEYIAPGSGYSIYLLWKLFNSTDYIIALEFSYILFLLSTIPLVIIFRRLTKNVFLLFVILTAWIALFSFIPLVNHNSHSTIISVWALFFLLQSERKMHSLFIGLTGAFIALTFWFLQTKGIALLAATLLYLLILKKNQIADPTHPSPVFRTHWTSTTCISTLKRGLKGVVYNQIKQRFIDSILLLAGFFTACLILFHPWGFKLTYKALFVMPQKINYMGATFFIPIYLVLMIIICGTMLYIAHKEKRSDYQILTVIQAGLFLSVMNNLNINHLAVTAYPSLLFFLGYAARNKRTFFEITLLSRIAIFITLTISSIFIDQMMALNSIANIFEAKRSKDNFWRIPDIDQIRNARYIYAGPLLPGFYYHLGKDNPFTDLNETIHCNIECQRKFVEKFEKFSPEFVIINYDFAKSFNYKKNKIDDYISQNYHVCTSMPQEILIIMGKACD